MEEKSLTPTSHAAEVYAVGFRFYVYKQDDEKPSRMYLHQMFKVGRPWFITELM